MAARKHVPCVRLRVCTVRLGREVTMYHDGGCPSPSGSPLLVDVLIHLPISLSGSPLLVLIGREVDVRQHVPCTMYHGVPCWWMSVWSCSPRPLISPTCDSAAPSRSPSLRRHTQASVVLCGPVWYTLGCVALRRMCGPPPDPPPCGGSLQGRTCSAGSSALQGFPPPRGPPP